MKIATIDIFDRLHILRATSKYLQVFELFILAPTTKTKFISDLDVSLKHVIQLKIVCFMRFMFVKLKPTKVSSETSLLVQGW